MCNEGFLIGSGFGRGTTYRLNREYVASSDLASSKATLKQQDDESAMSMIKIYCRQWKSAKQISLEIGRHPTYTREIIKKMVSDGILIQEYPMQPTHPAQRYRIK